jgi:hypothetical protein
MTIIYTITHPQALAAIWLAAKLEGLSPNLVTRVLNASKVPRKLFVLASTLRKQVSA